MRNKLLGVNAISVDTMLLTLAHVLRHVNVMKEYRMSLYTYSVDLEYG